MSITYHPKGNWDECLNISNGYAHVPSEMMGVSFATGHVPVLNLSRALDRARLAPISVHVVSHLQDDNVTHFGRSSKQIQAYRDRIVQLLQICIENSVSLEWG